MLDGGDRMQSHVYVSKFTTVNAAGTGTLQFQQALEQGRSGLHPNQFDGTNLEVYVGEVGGIDSVDISVELAHYNCRNNRLAQLCLQQDGFADYVWQLKQRYSDQRIGVIMGTSTSGIHKLEQDYRNINPVSAALPDDGNARFTHNLYSVASFVKAYFQLRGPAHVISTACSSSAKVFASAARMLTLGIVDAVIVGGVDSLCLNTLYGFDSLQLLSKQACQPLDVNRSGISIGEGAGFAVLENTAAYADFPIRLLGFGESSDSYHMSSPSPNGEGAVLSMQKALRMARLTPWDIAYINMHGTGTAINDKAESAAIGSLFDTDVPCSSSKGWFGHTLGAAGVIEAIVCFLALKNQYLPGTLNCRQLDPELGINALMQNQAYNVDVVLSNSFGFGGSNCSLIFGAVT